MGLPELNDSALSSFATDLEQELLTIINNSKLPSPLSDAVKYSVFPSGKRIRPRFAFSMLKDFGGNVQDLLSAVAALELMHCATLIHDDLPALDNDDVRRGKLTCHRQFGEATAILAGDVLPLVAINAIPTIEYARVLATAYRDVCAGQQLDLINPKNSDLFTLFRLKTGALFGAAAQCAAIASKRERDLEHARQFGESFGVLFQIADDFADKDKKANVAVHVSRLTLARAKDDLNKALIQLEVDIGNLENTRDFIDYFIAEIDT